MAEASVLGATQAHASLGTQTGFDELLGPMETELATFKNFLESTELTGAG